MWLGWIGKGVSRGNQRSPFVARGSFVQMHRLFWIVATVTSLLLGTVRAESLSTGSISGSTSSTESDDDTWKLVLVLCGAVAAGAAVTSPIWVPLYLTDDQWSEPGRFLSYPYPRGKTGDFTLTPLLQRDADPEAEEMRILGGLASRSTDWMGRLSIDAGSDFGHASRYTSSLFLTTTSRLGMASTWTRIEETRDSQYQGRWLGDAFLTFRFAQHERAHFYIGAGPRMQFSADDAEVGMSAGYGFDLFPVKPMVLSVWLDGGTLGRPDVFRVGRGRFLVGSVYRSLEVYAGYEVLCIGSDRQQGPLLGLRLWF